MTVRVAGPVERRIAAAVSTALLVFLFVSLVLYIRAFEPDASGFEQQGPPLLLYHLSRLGLVCFVLILCYSAGYHALALLRFSPPGLFDSARKILILCFFFGASLYGIVFTALGLAGLITLETALASTIPVLLFSHRPLQAFRSKFLESEAALPSSDTYASKPFVWFVILLAGIAVLAFLLTRVVYLAVFDPNIWEHYLHYYRAVLASGSTQPNEVWHHFYASKGAGLILLTNVLSDFFGAQIVSACFVVVAAVIILDLLLEHCESPSWAFFGVVLYLAFLYGGVSDGATFKHHGVLLGYASFALWGAVSLQNTTAAQFRPLMTVMFASLAYVGFYLPVTAVLFSAAFAFIALTNVLFRATTQARSFLVLACGMFAGAGLAFATNLALTGLIEVTPMRWFWAIADQAKVERVFGTGGVEFFLRMNNDLRPEYDWSLNRAWSILRYPLPATLVYWGLLGLLIALIQGRTRAAVAGSAKFLAYLAAFILPLSIFAQAVQTNAVDRMALYSIVLMTLVSVVMLKKLVDAYVGPKIWRVPVETVASDGKRVPAGVEIRLWHIASMAIIVCGMTSAITLAWKGMVKKQRPIIYMLATGEISLKESFQLVESNVAQTKIGIGIAAMTEFRKINLVDGRILRLSYEGGFSYSLPGEGIVSEPTYSLIRNPQHILAGSPEQVAGYLRERGIQYFALDLQSRLFSTVAFTSLFAADEMSKHFSVAYEDGDVFMLTWRKRTDERPPSSYFLTMFEIKRTGVLHLPFTERFGARLLGTADELVRSIAGFETIRKEFKEDLEKAFASEMLPLVSMKSSKTLLHSILDVAKDAVDNADPDMLVFGETQPPLRRILDAGEDRSQVRIVEKVWGRDLKIQLLRIVRDEIYKKYRKEMGKEIALLFLYCDERVPFAADYPAGVACYR